VGAERLTFPDEADVFAVPGLHVTVDAVVAGIGLAAGEPLGVGGFPFKHVLEGREPVEELGLVGPERHRVVDARLVQALVVFERADVPAREVVLAGFLGGKGARLKERGLDRVAGGVGRIRRGVLGHTACSIQAKRPAH
jgi:hypothetical protein